MFVITPPKTGASFAPVTVTVSVAVVGFCTTPSVTVTVNTSLAVAPPVSALIAMAFGVKV